MVEYKVDMRVRYQYDRDHVGTVTEVVDETELLVQWDNGRTGRVDPDEIAPFDPEGDKVLAVKMQAKIDEATASLEAVFAALREAHKLETGHERDDGFYGLRHNPLLDMSKFEDVVEGNGWSVSSIYC